MSDDIEQRVIDAQASALTKANMRIAELEAMLEDTLRTEKELEAKLATAEQDRDFFDEERMRLVDRLEGTDGDHLPDLSVALARIEQQGARIAELAAELAQMRAEWQEDGQ